MAAIIALGGNLPSPVGGPAETLRAALARMAEQAGWRVSGVSAFYRTVPVPPTGQPDFVNAVAVIETSQSAPEDLLDQLHALEREFGRTRRVTWEARALDLDLLDVGGRVQPSDWPGGARTLPGEPACSRPLVLPHPRLHERTFVLYPLRDVAPHWRHPVLGLTPGQMIEDLGPHETPVCLDSEAADGLDGAF